MRKSPGLQPARCAEASQPAAIPKSTKPAAQSAFSPDGRRTSERSSKAAKASATRAAQSGSSASRMAGAFARGLELMAVTGPPGGTIRRYAKSRPPNMPSCVATKE